MEKPVISEDEVGLLLDDLLNLYGYDFTDYAKASMSRRLNRLFHLDKFKTFKNFRQHLRDDKSYCTRVVEEITVNVTEMFRDPLFYKILNEKVFPVLATYPFIRIWHAGCSTGEEVYSIAILLKEANLLNKSLIYATDINSSVLERAAKGIFPLGEIKHYSENYIASGGRNDFSDYYTARYDHAKFNDELHGKMIFSAHNLVIDKSFNEFQLIICRNVLIYFNKLLQDKVLSLFDDSLESLCFLALGMKESIKFSPVAKKYEAIASKEKIWRKIN
ncbi:MAG: protein-glutamate O-methyltransferase CheR [Chitinophagaceae bacterium]